jgi:C1q domain
MKLKVYVVDLEMSPSARKWTLGLGIPLTLLFGGGALAWAASGLTAWEPGDTLQAAALNRNFTYLQSEISTPALSPRTPSAFLAERTTELTAGSRLIVPIVFDKTLFDLDAEYDAATGVFTPKQAGIYILTCAVSWTTAAAGEVQSAILLKNGQDLDGTDLVAGAPNVTFMRPEVTTIVQLSATDQVQCATYQGSPSAATTDTSRPDRNRFAASRLY